MTKPGLGISFWSIYTLGFTVALPAFLYYNTGSAEEPPQQSATVALLYLGLGIVAWLVAIGLYTRFFIGLVFTDKQRLEKTASEGTTITAKITEQTQVGVLRDTAVLDLKLAFRNLAGIDVEVPYRLNDGKPYENRFEVGNTIEMSVRIDGQHITFVPKTLHVSRNKGIVLLYSIVFLLLLTAAIAYPAFSYAMESQGSGWRFLRLSHPWISVPLINLGVGAFIWALLHFISKASGGQEQPLPMVMYGRRAKGNILSYRQTGMYINEQPQVQFQVEYTDQQGNRHTVPYRKIISLLEVHKVDKGPKEIMYLPGEPSNIIFYEDLSV
jgi:hypothetical protein